jgi:hypothetical protein
MLSTATNSKDLHSEARNSMARQEKRNVIILAVLTLTIVVVFSSYTYLISQTFPPKKVGSIVIGNAQSFECDTLVYIAQNQNYFANNGLNVTILNYTSGMFQITHGDLNWKNQTIGHSSKAWEDTMINAEIESFLSRNRITVSLQYVPTCG